MFQSQEQHKQPYIHKDMTEKLAEKNEVSNHDSEENLSVILIFDHIAVMPPIENHSECVPDIIYHYFNHLIIRVDLILIKL